MWINFEGSLFTKDGVNVMEKLVGTSDHDHLVWLALFPFLVVIIFPALIRTFPEAHCIAKYKARFKCLDSFFVIRLLVAVNFFELNYVLVDGRSAA